MSIEPDKYGHPSGLYSATDLAAAAGVSMRTLYRWVSEGKVPNRRGIGNRLVFEASDLNEVFSIQTLSDRARSVVEGEIRDRMTRHFNKGA